MNLLESLRPECVRVDAKPAGKQELLREIARLAGNCPALSGYPEDRIFQALREREKIGSTGFGEGIAIPHCALENLKEFVVGVLTARQGVEFEAVDGKPVHLFFFIIGPPEQRTRHIQLLSGISKILKERDVVRRLTGASDAEQVMEILRPLAEAHAGAAPARQAEQCLFHVFVQREEYFNDILEVFSASVQGSVTVIESRNVSHYLYRIPLFAAYWTEERAGFSRLIMAVVDKNFCNDIIRRIHTIAENITGEPGVLIAVQELFYTTGSIEF